MDLYIKLRQSDEEQKLKSIADRLIGNLDLGAKVLSILSDQPVTDNDIYIAGGAIRDLWFKEPFKDIDIFFVNDALPLSINKILNENKIYVTDSEEDDQNNNTEITEGPPSLELDPSFIEKIKSSFNFKSSNYEDREIVDISLSPRGNLNITLNGNIVLQFILEKAAPPNLMISTFDFNINKNFLSTTGIYLNEDLLKAKNKEDVILRSDSLTENPEFAIMRILKFSQKGYSVDTRTYTPLLNALKNSTAHAIKPNIAISNVNAGWGGYNS